MATDIPANGAQVAAPAAEAGLTADSIAQRIERVPVVNYHRKLMGFLGLGMLFDAFDVYIIGVVAIAISSFTVTDADIGVIISASYVGQLFGALFFGYLAEIYGRKTSFIGAMGSFAVLSVVASFAWSVQSLAMIRVLQGLGIGALPPVAGVMFSEFLTAPRRGKYGVLFQALYPVGVTISPLLGSLFFYWFGPERAWHLLFLFGGLPLLFAIYAHYKMPESPRWLAARGRLAEADAVVSAIEDSAAKDGVTLGPLPPPAPPIAARRTSLTELFSRDYRRRTALVWIQSFTAFFVVNVFTSFLPRLLTTVGGLSRQDALRLTSGFGLIQLGLILTMAFLWDRHGRKPWFVAGYTVAVLGAAAAWAAFDLLHFTGWVVLVAAGLPMVLGVYVSVGGVYVYHPELYPTRMRSWATSTGRAWRCIASIIAPLVVGQILSAQLGAGPIFAMFGVVSLVGLIAILWLGIETKGIALEKLAH